MPFVIRMQRLWDLTQEVHGKQHGLHLRERWNRPKPRTDKTYEADGGIIRFPDLANVSFTRAGIRLGAGVLSRVEKGEGREVASGKDHDIWLDNPLIYAQRLRATVEGEVGHSMGVNMRRERGNVNNSWGRRDVCVEEELADPCPQRVTLGTPGIGAVVRYALPRFVEEDWPWVNILRLQGVLMARCLPLEA